MADFTAGPLQSLLSSVDQEQRLLYITQLKIQYDACSSESDRFGILKLLLPTVAAVDDSAIAQEILKPIVLESFQVDSMISTESIALIVATLAQRIAGALNNNQSDFSIDLLQLLLCDLVSAMQTEIDLVELDPFGYIDLHLTNSEEWNTIKAKSTRDDQIGQLDLECCMDTLGQIILYAQTGNPWIEIITLIGVALMSCTEQTLRSKATNDIIAAVYERQTNIEKKVEICQASLYEISTI
ncbi:hypothetical protein NQZ79_g6963 [Umbelopsis isabellina]|nr:hypothetical protein NQZ79_g6963 [Umbelopsis isabellina]